MKLSPVALTVLLKTSLTYVRAALHDDAKSGVHAAVCCDREFGEVLEAVRGPNARVVAVTSADRAAAVNAEHENFFESVTRVV